MLFLASVSSVSGKRPGKRCIVLPVLFTVYIPLFFNQCSITIYFRRDERFLHGPPLRKIEFLGVLSHMIAGRFKDILTGSLFTPITAFQFANGILVSNLPRRLNALARAGSSRD